MVGVGGMQLPALLMTCWIIFHIHGHIAIWCMYLPKKCVGWGLAPLVPTPMSWSKKFCCELLTITILLQQCNM